MTVPPAPSVECPWCFRMLTVEDTECWSCGTSFAPRQLWDLYEASLAK